MSQKSLIIFTYIRPSDICIILGYLQAVFLPAPFIPTHTEKRKHDILRI